MAAVVVVPASRLLLRRVACPALRLECVGRPDMAKVLFAVATSSRTKSIAPMYEALPSVRVLTLV